MSLIMIWQKSLAMHEKKNFYGGDFEVGEEIPRKNLFYPTTAYFPMGLSSIRMQT